MRTITNNFAKVKASIAARILASPLAAFIGYPGHSGRLAQLTDLVAVTDLKPTGSLNVEFRRADTNISLYVEHDAEWRDKDVKDDDGNEYVRYDFRFELNWPCHGSTRPDVAMARLRLYSDVAMLAAELTAEFGSMHEVYHLLRTKAQREELEAKKVAERVKGDVVSTMEKRRRGLRVGAVLGIPTTDVQALPTGSYDHEFADGKAYTLVVSGHAIGMPMGLVTRTK